MKHIFLKKTFFLPFLLFSFFLFSPQVTAQNAATDAQTTEEFSSGSNLQTTNVPPIETNDSYVKTEDKKDTVEKTNMPVPSLSGTQAEENEESAMAAIPSLEKIEAFKTEMKEEILQITDNPIFLETVYVSFLSTIREYIKQIFMQQQQESEAWQAESLLLMTESNMDNLTLKEKAIQCFSENKGIFLEEKGIDSLSEKCALPNMMAYINSLKTIFGKGNISPEDGYIFGMIAALNENVKDSLTATQQLDESESEYLMAFALSRQNRRQAVEQLKTCLYGKDPVRIIKEDFSAEQQQCLDNYENELIVEIFKVALDLKKLDETAQKMMPQLTDLPFSEKSAAE